MSPYWLLFILPVLGALCPVRGDAQVRAFAFGLFATIATLMIGLRYEVGGDWGSYLEYVEMSRGISLLEAMTIHDPGYMALNWLSVQLGLGVAGVNLMGGALFMYGLLRFCRQQPLPWLGLVVATPFLLIVVGMGYSRQAIALGFVFWAFSVWRREGFIEYSTLILLAALFHKSAVIMLGFGLFINNRHLWVKWLLALPVLLFASWSLIVTSTFESQFNAYVAAKSYESEGGLIRVLMNVFPASILLLVRKRFAQFDDHRLWWMVGVASLLMLFATSSLSTVTDRFALYLAPIQVAVYSRLPVLIRDRFWRTLVVLLITFLYASVLFVWMNYASHAEYWLPYRWILLS